MGYVAIADSVRGFLSVPRVCVGRGAFVAHSSAEIFEFAVRWKRDVFLRPLRFGGFEVASSATPSTRRAVRWPTWKGSQLICAKLKIMQTRRLGHLTVSSPRS